LDEFKNLLDKLYKSVVSSVDISQISPLQNGERIKIEFFQKDKGAQSSIIEAITFNDGLKKEKNEKIFNYNEVEGCNVCYNVGEVQQLKNDAECCSKFKLGQSDSYACIDEDSNCEGKLKMLIKKIFDRCVEMNKDKFTSSSKPDICPEGAQTLKAKQDKGAAGNQGLLGAGNNGAANGNGNGSGGNGNGGNNNSGTGSGLSSGDGKSSNGGVGNANGSGSDSDGKGGLQAEKADAANKIGDVKNLLNNLGQKTPTKSEQTKEGLLKTNSDGSTTLVKPDGSQVIREKDGTLINVAPNGSMKINQNGVISDVSPDGNVSIKDPNDGSTITLDPSGNIQKTKLNKNGMSKKNKKNILI
jgi:hypothetical protein